MKRIFLSLFSIFLLTLSIAYGNHTSIPSNVNITGSFQDELGCSGPWQPDCVNSNISYHADDDLWQGTFSIPAGDWEYKATLNGSWDEQYGSNAGSNNITLSLSSLTEVKFYYDHETHWVTDTHNSIIATVPGNYQSAIGCPGDWDPGCLRSWLQDVGGNGIYSFSTSDIPAGSYEAKVTHNESWDENYGEGGIANGSNIPFVVSDGATVTFEYNPANHILTIHSDGDIDFDGIPNSEDNCPSTPNQDQEDSFPPQTNNCGDVCECEGNFDGDQDQDGTDAATFKDYFGRSRFGRPCINWDPCLGDADCDQDVDGTDASLFKTDFGRSPFGNPCPSCPTIPWCYYP